MQVSGMRAVLAVRDALDRAGLGRTSGYSGGANTGWIPSNLSGSTGFSVRKDSDGSLGWNVVLSGKPHLSYRKWTERDSDGERELHEPRNPELLNRRIAAVFEELGIPVSKVRYSGAQMHWDDDIDYTVSTPHPEWLAKPDPKNAFQAGDGPMLRGMVFDDRLDESVVLLNGPLVGYVVEGASYLTRESVSAIVDAAKQSLDKQASYVANYEPGKCPAWLKARRTTASLSEEGEFLVDCPRMQPARITPVTLTNHWGDEVAAWRMPRAWMKPLHGFNPSVPFLLDGEMRTEATFALVDAQHGGEAPWLEQAPGPAPR